MTILLVTLLVVYVSVAIAVFIVHAMYLQMVTPGLAALRAVFWPLLWTGWFRGTPLPMD